MSIIKRRIIDTNPPESSGGGGDISLPIEITDVNNLQQILDSKINGGVLDSYYKKTEVDSYLATIYNKTEIDTYLADYYKKNQIDNFFTDYYKKSQVDAYLADYYKKTEVDTFVSNKLDKNPYESRINAKKVFNRRFFTNTPGTITGTQTVRILDRLQVDTSLGYEQNTTSTYNFTTGTNAFVKENIDSYFLDNALFFELRFANSVNIGNTTLEIRLLRQSDNSIITRKQFSNDDPQGRGIGNDINSSFYGSTDPFVINGYYFEITNLTNQVLSYNSIVLKTTLIRDRGY